MSHHRFSALASSCMKKVERRLQTKQKSLEVFRQTLNGPNSDRCSTAENNRRSEILQFYDCRKEQIDADNTHVELIKKGFSSDTFLCNNLITAYVKAYYLDCAHQVFDEIIDKNSVSWTCLISGYTQQGLLNDVCRLFRLMLVSGFAPTKFTYGSVLSACQDSGPDGLCIGSQVHGLVIKSLYFVDIVVCNSLLSMYGGCCLDSASNSRKVFDGMPVKNLISWNSITSVLSQRGDCAASFEIFSDMQRSNDEFGHCLEPNEYTFGSLIAAAYHASSLHIRSRSSLLEQMLARISKSGFLGDLYVGSALVSAFARLGLPDEAKEIYSTMGERNAVSMNGLMVGLIRLNREVEAIKIFREMRLSVVFNLDSYVIILSACAESKSPEDGIRKGKEVHGSIVRSGLLGSRVMLKNALMNMYAKCGAIEEASKLFQCVVVQDQISWNTIISGLDQNSRFEEALATFREMLRSGVVPANYAIISSLSSCTSLCFLSMGRQLHCHAIKLGLDLDISVSNSLLSFYGECNHLTYCWEVFRSMADYDQISWNSMIGALADSKASPIDSMTVILDMMRGGWKPNRVTFINILAALSPFSIVELNKQLHALVLKHGASDDSVVANALLSCYSRSGEIHDCESLFAEMYDKRDEVSWNSMVAGYIHNGLLTRAMDFIWFMMQDERKMDHFTFATVLSACASGAALERGMESHAFGIRTSLETDVVVGSTLVDMYAKCGRIDYASTVFSYMPLRNEFSWNSLISGYARHGHGKRAVKLFRDMLRENQQPNHVTFVGVLSACSHAGLVEEGLDYFESMSKDYGLTPHAEHYSCVTDLLGRAGRLDKLEDFIKNMPFSPNMLIWRTVLVACSRKRGGAKTELATQASKMLLELEPQNPVNYVLTSNLYASSGEWHEVAKARSAMRGALVSKEAGCSWVTLRDGVHVFAAGDKSHSDTEMIYAKLSFLNQKLREAGYVPQLEYALYDLEVETKEELLSYHSEKIAVAFVLTRTSGGPIRIMKNLRVCGDCHSAFRYISKITERQIILRDSNRFHHFDNGRCSCGDFW